MTEYAIPNKSFLSLVLTHPDTRHSYRGYSPPVVHSLVRRMDIFQPDIDTDTSSIKLYARVSALSLFTVY